MGGWQEGKGEFAISILAEGRGWPLPRAPSSFPMPNNLLEKEKMIITSWGIRILGITLQKYLAFS